MADKHTHESL